MEFMDVTCRRLLETSLAPTRRPQTPRLTNAEVGAKGGSRVHVQVLEVDLDRVTPEIVRT
jgi:hypothetical protein